MTTTPPDPHPDEVDPFDAVLHAAHSALVDDLRARLDLTAGVEEATEPAPYQSLTRDLARDLDVERGLAAIAGDPTSTDRQHPPAPDGEPTSMASRSPSGHGGLSDPQRLELRITPGFRALRSAVALEESLAEAASAPAHDLVRDLDRARRLAHAALDHDFNLDMVLDLVLDLDRARVLARDIDRALARGDRELARSLASDLEFHVVHSDTALRLADALGLTRDRDLDRALALTRGLSRVLALSRRERARELADLLRRVMVRVVQEYRRALQKQLDDLARDLGLHLDAVADVGKDWPVGRVRAVLDGVADDFVDADVHLARLPDDADLVGVRWSPGTRWPPGWPERVRAMSAEIAPGVFAVVGPEGRRSPTFATT